MQKDCSDPKKLDFYGVEKSTLFLCNETGCYIPLCAASRNTTGL
jgi:hypothetical protein